MDKFLLQSLCLVLCLTHEILDERKYTFNINVKFWVCWTNIDVVKSIKKKQQNRCENTAPELKTNKETPKMHFNLPNLSDSVRHRLSTPANPDTICYYRWLFFCPNVSKSDNAAVLLKYSATWTNWFRWGPPSILYIQMCLNAYSGSSAWLAHKSTMNSMNQNTCEDSCWIMNKCADISSSCEQWPSIADVFKENHNYMDSKQFECQRKFSIPIKLIYRESFAVHLLLLLLLLEFV